MKLCSKLLMLLLIVTSLVACNGGGGGGGDQKPAPTPYPGKKESTEDPIPVMGPQNVKKTFVTYDIDGSKLRIENIGYCYPKAGQDYSRIVNSNSTSKLLNCEFARDYSKINWRGKTYYIYGEIVDVDLFVIGYSKLGQYYIKQDSNMYFGETSFAKMNTDSSLWDKAMSEIKDIVSETTTMSSILNLKERRDALVLEQRIKLSRCISTKKYAELSQVNILDTGNTLVNLGSFNYFSRNSISMLFALEVNLKKQTLVGFPYVHQEKVNYNFYDVERDATYREFYRYNENLKNAVSPFDLKYHLGLRDFFLECDRAYNRFVKRDSEYQKLDIDLLLFFPTFQEDLDKVASREVDSRYRREESLNNFEAKATLPLSFVWQLDEINKRMPMRSNLTNEAMQFLNDGEYTIYNNLGEIR